MHMSLADLASSVNPPWSEDFVWVQKTALLRIEGMSAGHVRVRHHDGELSDLTREEAEADYFPIHKRKYLKPRYRPAQAHVLNRPVRFGGSGTPSPDQEMTLEVGDVVLLCRDQPPQAIRRDAYIRDYEAVSYWSEEDRPDLPFFRDKDHRQTIQQVNP